jgi:ADP-ribose pyrophosphatase YjhB (NUDIX family)
VGAVVSADDGAVLLIRRGRAPGRGRWSLPGGRVEPGEDERAAVVREVREETGLRVRPERLLGRVRLPGPPGVVFEVADYTCRLESPPADARAGDDAEAVAWVRPEDIDALALTDGLAGHLRAWGVL